MLSKLIRHCDRKLVLSHVNLWNKNLNRKNHEFLPCSSVQGMLAEPAMINVCGGREAAPEGATCRDSTRLPCCTQVCAPLHQGSCVELEADQQSYSANDFSMLKQKIKKHGHNRVLNT